LRESAKVNVAPVKSFPLIALKMFSNLFGKFATDYQQISRTRVVVSTSLVVRCEAARGGCSLPRQKPFQMPPLA
jgi:hypothetical protein